MINVLLTGGTGFLGRQLSNALSSNDCEVIELTSGIERRRIDISNPFDFELSQPLHTIIHAAGKAHSVPKTESERNAFYNVNYHGTRNLCKAIERLSVLPKSFIFISTAAVYGIDEGNLIDEEYPLNGKTPYAKSKILAEGWLQEWSSRNQITLGILRLPLIAGPNPPGNLGAMIKGIRQGRYLSIGKANARKSIVWVEDVAKVIPVLAKKGGVYNLTDGHHPTFGELEAAIATALRKKKPYKIPYWFANGLAKAGDMIGDRFPINSDKLKKITSTLTLNDRKAREVLGWNPSPLLSKIDLLV